MQTHQDHMSNSHGNKKPGNAHAGNQGHYGRLMVELAIDFVIMYLVMFTMIRSLDHFYNNINNVWMTLMMVTPMALVMLAAMRSMFPSRKRNLLVIAGAALVRTSWQAAPRRYSTGRDAAAPAGPPSTRHA